MYNIESAGKKTCSVCFSQQLFRVASSYSVLIQRSAKWKTFRDARMCFCIRFARSFGLVFLTCSLKFEFFSIDCIFFSKLFFSKTNGWNAASKARFMGDLRRGRHVSLRFFFTFLWFIQDLFETRYLLKLVFRGQYCLDSDFLMPYLKPEKKYCNWTAASSLSSLNESVFPIHLL